MPGLGHTIGPKLHRIPVFRHVPGLEFIQKLHMRSGTIDLVVSKGKDPLNLYTPLQTHELFVQGGSKYSFHYARESIPRCTSGLELGSFLGDINNLSQMRLPDQPKG